MTHVLQGLVAVSVVVMLAAGMVDAVATSQRVADVAVGVMTVAAVVFLASFAVTAVAWVVA